MHLIRFVLMFSGILGLALSVRLSMVSNMNVGLALMYVVSAGLLLYGSKFASVQRILSRGFGRIIKRLLIIGALLVFATSLYIYFYGTQDNVTYKEDAIIALGGGVKGQKVTAPLRNRLDATIHYLHKNANALVIVSGGKGFEEDVAESYAMKKYLVENGISADQIIEENQSTSTTENFKFSKRILASKLGSRYTVAFVTNDFHIFRSVQLAKLQGLKVTHLHTTIPWYTIVNNYIRECLAIVKWLIFRY